MKTPNPSDPRYIDWLVQLAAENKMRGVIEEPRVYYDTVTLSDTNPKLTPFTNDVYRNGEQFPVRLTHMIVTPRPDLGGNPPLYDDERLVQWIGLRLRFHDTFYMNNQLLPAPLWVNKLTSAPDPISRGTSHWTFDRPVILSARDTLRIDVQQEPLAFAEADGAHYVGAALTGVGLLSKRPYFLSSNILIDPDTSARQTLSPGDFKNDGTEPIALTDMAFTVSGGVEESTASGDIRSIRSQIQQLGNGTGRPWFFGPSGLPLCPSSVLGISAGRSVVHRFPGDGVIWEPGEGVTVEAEPLQGDVEGMDIVVAFAGYITLR